LLLDLLKESIEVLSESMWLVHLDEAELVLLDLLKRAQSLLLHELALFELVALLRLPQGHLGVDLMLDLFARCRVASLVAVLDLLERLQYSQVQLVHFPFILAFRQELEPIRSGLYHPVALECGVVPPPHAHIAHVEVVYHLHHII
jgi:hypothetical protein